MAFNRNELLKRATSKKGGGQMCRGVIIHQPGQADVRCDTQGELAAVIGEKNIKFTDYPEFGPSVFEPMICLCPVDMEATAKAAGFVWSEEDPAGEFDAFDDHFYK